jgi:thiamine-phosphate diphosphorylase
MFEMTIVYRGARRLGRVELKTMIGSFRWMAVIGCIAASSAAMLPSFLGSSRGRPSRVFWKSSEQGRVALANSQPQPADAVQTSSPWSFASPPFIALITPATSCNDDEEMQATIEALTLAVSTRLVSLVLIRIDRGPDDELDEADKRLRVKTMIEAMIKVSHCQESQWLLDQQEQSPLPSEVLFRLVVSSDWLDVALETFVHGIHFKEKHQHLIPAVMNRTSSSSLILGTSAHSLTSARRAAQQYPLDYLLVGTCFVTPSHPEKSAQTVQGPALPGQVARALKDGQFSPVVFGIGGIDVANCREVRREGADGVALIRSVCGQADPAQAVRDLHRAM